MGEIRYSPNEAVRREPLSVLVFSRVGGVWATHLWLRVSFRSRHTNVAYVQTSCYALPKMLMSAGKNSGVTRDRVLTLCFKAGRAVSSLFFANITLIQWHHTTLSANNWQAASSHLSSTLVIPALYHTKQLHVNCQTSKAAPLTFATPFLPLCSCI